MYNESVLVFFRVLDLSLASKKLFVRLYKYLKIKSSCSVTQIVTNLRER